MINLSTPVTTNMIARDISCPFCQCPISVPVHCVCVPCHHCKRQIDLNDDTVNPRKDNDQLRHSDLYLKERHQLDVSKMYVGNAVISGKFKGHLYSSGTVKILEHGEFYGTISCRKFLIRKGGIFDGKLLLMHERKLGSLPGRNYYQILMK